MRNELAKEGAARRGAIPGSALAQIDIQIVTAPPASNGAARSLIDAKIACSGLAPLIMIEVSPVFRYPASCYLVAADLERWVSKMAEEEFDLPEDPPDATFKRPAWMDGGDR